MDLQNVVGLAVQPALPIISLKTVVLDRHSRGMKLN